VGIPEWYFPRLDRVYGKLLPDQVLKNQIAQQFILRREVDTLVVGESPVGFPLIEIVGWDEGFGAHRHRPEENER
jgi:hypothetical protein